MILEIHTLLIAFLILMSAICSGLNIALMSLNPGDLKRKTSLRNKQAELVYPLRKNSHLTLASILLTNVAVISATSLVLGHMLNGIIAGIASTLLIVIFGEVVPQALFAKHALFFCAAFSPLLRIMIIITFPISKPLQLLLDILMGHETSNLQSRSELGLLIGEHAQSEKSELDEDEVEIMKGALLLSEKTVSNIMTPVRRVYWLYPDDLIDGSKIDEIKRHGRSRIPVFNRQKTIAYGILLMKDLIDIDFNVFSKRVSDLKLYKTSVVGSRTALDTLFRKFIRSKTHLLPVEQAGKIIGIVTIEDLIEEIFQQEIEDETDRARSRVKPTR